MCLPEGIGQSQNGKGASTTMRMVKKRGTEKQGNLESKVMNTDQALLLFLLRLQQTFTSSLPKGNLKQLVTYTHTQTYFIWELVPNLMKTY